MRSPDVVLQVPHSWNMGALSLAIWSVFVIRNHHGATHDTQHTLQFWPQLHRPDSHLPPRVCFGSVAIAYASGGIFNTVSIQHEHIMKTRIYLLATM
jgi:hypothetical protein